MMLGSVEENEKIPYQSSSSTLDLRPRYTFVLWLMKEARWIAKIQHHGACSHSQKFQ